MRLSDYALQESPNDNESTGEQRISKMIYDAIQNCISCVEEQMTAYSVDKVVEELETKENEAILKAPNTSDLQNPDYQKWMMKSYGFREAIEIVKQSGVADDVCEWKSASDGEFIQNPHTNRLYSNEPSMKNVYCNTCGKKIKVIGD